MFSRSLFAALAALSLAAISGFSSAEAESLTAGPPRDEAFLAALK